MYKKNDVKNINDWQILVVITLSITVIVMTISSFTGHWVIDPSSQNTYAIQAQAWLNGRVDVSDYSHLELAYYKDKVFVSFPPLPSVIMLPFVLFLGTHTPDGLINLFFMVVGVFYAYKLAKNYNNSIVLSLFLAFFISISTNVVFLMQNGWVWFFAQTLSFTFTIIALYFATKQEPNFYLSFFFLALAIGCRPFQIFYGVAILYLAYKTTHNLKSLLLFILPALAIGSMYAVYNYVRFDSIIEFGHNYLTEVTQSKYGKFSLMYLVENLKKLYFIPSINNNGVVDYPEFNGFSIFIINPILILILILLPIYFLSAYNKRFTCLQPSAVPLLSILLISAIVHTIVICTHITMGGWHFGNRYLIDTLPALFMIFCIVDSKIPNFRIFYIPFFLYGMTFNILGTTVFYMKSNI